MGQFRIQFQGIVMDVRAFRFWRPACGLFVCLGFGSSSILLTADEYVDLHRLPQIDVPIADTEFPIPQAEQIKLLAPVRAGATEEEDLPTPSGLGIEPEPESDYQLGIKPVQPVKADPRFGLPKVSPAVIERAKQLNESAVSSARRRAYYSARAKFLRALQTVTQAIDSASGSRYHSLALADGLRALDEAKDFSPAGSQLASDLDLKQIVQSHRTPVLKREDLDRLTIIHALQAYHGFAREQLASATAKVPVASASLSGLAKIQSYLGESNAINQTLLIPRSMAMYQAALDTDERNVLAANELGVLFAKFGQMEDAKHALAHCIKVDPNQPVAWKNLARVHEQLGESHLATAAQEEFQLAQSNAEESFPIQWVDAKTFSAGSPKGGVARPQLQTQKQPPRALRKTARSKTRSKNNGLMKSIPKWLGRSAKR